MRTPRIAVTCLFLASFALIASTAATAQTLYVTGGDGSQLWKVNTTTGAGTLVGATGTSATFAAAFGPDGKLYTVTDSYSANGRMATLDLSTGAATIFGGPVGVPALMVLETLPNGTMVGASWQTNQLYTMNLATGLPTLVGSLGFGNIMDFAVNSAGELWGVNNTDLFKINPATGASSHVVAIAPAAGGCVMSIAFDAADTLFATNYCSGNSDLYRINTTTGAVTVVGTTGIANPHGGDVEPAGDPNLYLTGGDGSQLWKVNTTTGAGTLIGATGTFATFATAFGPDGKLYTVTDSYSANGRMATLDTNTGAATIFGGPVGVPALMILETLPNGTMVGASWQTNRLYTMNLTTGLPTLVGPLGFANVMDFAVNNAGELWGVNNTDLFKINPATGASSHVVAIAPAAGGCVMSIAFDAADNLFATNYCSGNSALYRIDTATGAVTVVGTTGIANPHGGDFRPGSAPPPDPDLYLTGGDGSQLWKVNTTTGVGSLIGATGTFATFATAFGPDGKLYTVTDSYSANGRMATLDTNTGAATIFGGPVGVPALMILETLPNGTMVGASWQTNRLYTMNLTTGLPTLVGPLGFGNVMDFAVNSAGELWGVNNTDLFKINPATGASSHVVAIAPAAGGCVMSIAFDAADRLFATNYCSGNSDLYRIDTATGAVTIIGTTGIANPHGGDFRSGGVAPPPVNQPPTADAGAAQSFEATGPAGADFTLDGTGSNDPDGDALTYEWVGPFGTVTGATPTVTLFPPPIGQQSITYTVTLMVHDESGSMDHDTVDLTVTDTTGPTLSGNPGDLTVEGNVAGGANVSFGPFSAADAVDGNQPVACSHAPGFFPLGVTEVTCSASDLHTNTSSFAFAVTVQDTTAPVLTLPAPITVHASGPSGAAVSYSASAHDTVWGDVPVVCEPASGSTFALGTTSVSCTVADGSANTAGGTFTVTVTNTAPTCAATPSVSLLWSPNHQLVPITINGASDADGDPLTVLISSIHQDEPTNTKGDGNTPVDATGIGTSTASVRAERAGGGDGRVYHISFSVTDIVGASCSGVVNVAVPHDQGKGRVPVDNGPLFSSTGQ